VWARAGLEGSERIATPGHEKLEATFLYQVFVDLRFFPSHQAIAMQRSKRSSALVLRAKRRPRRSNGWR
jgi:hypothetical protein